MSRDDLASVLDYILNKADDAEFEVIQKACERRRADRSRYAGLGGFNPGALAGRMADSVNEGLQASMGSIRGTVLQLVEGIIRENAPEASEEQVQALLAHYVPSSSPGESAGRGIVDEDARVAEAADAGGLPPEALAVMLEEFLEYTLGAMLPSRQKELWDELPGWPEKYWASFPPALKSLVKARAEGRLDDDRFWKAALGALGL